MFIEIENIKYHVQISGEGRPLVCLHGFSESISTWRSLQAEQYQLILIDLIGHGESDKPCSVKYYRVKVMLKHLNRLIAQSGLQKYSLLGYSMGGRLALAYALTYPREVDKLILESASYGECGWINRLQRRRSDAELARSIRRNGIAWFNEYWSDQPIFASQKKLPAPIADEISTSRLANAAHALANTLLGSGQGRFPCLKNQIAGLLMPVLYISGEYDEKYKQTGHEFEKLNPNIRHEIIKSVGHNTHLENYSAFNGVLKTFL